MSRFGLLALIALAVFAVLPGDASAQCSMCRTALEQNSEVAAGFNRAILFLLAMPYAVFACGAGYVLFSRRKRRAQAAAAIVREVRAPALRSKDPISATS